MTKAEIYWKYNSVFVIMTDILTMIVLGVASTLSVSVVALGVAARIRTVSKRAKRMSQRLPSGTSTHSIHPR